LGKIIDIIIKLFYKADFHRYGFILLGLYTLIPLILISFFNHPLGDDYSFAVESRNRGLCNSLMFWYFNWTPHLLPIAIISIISSGSWFFVLYKIVPIVLIILLGISILLLLNKIFQDTLFLTIKFGLVSVFLFLFFTEMPNIRQGIYWLAGSLTYILPVILFVFFIISLIGLFSKRKSYLNNIVFSTVIIISMNACSELFSLITLYILLLFLAFNFYYTRKMNYNALLLLLIAISIAAVVILAPGNLVREACSIYLYSSDPAGRKDIILASVNSLKTEIHYVYTWLSNPLLIISSLFFVGLVDEIISKMKYNFLKINPFLSSAILLSAIFIMIFPSYWATNFFVDRIANPAYFIFLLGYFFNLMIFVSIIKRKYEYTFIKSPVYVRVAFIAMIVLSLNYTNQTNNIRYAYVDLFKGTAYRYNNELNTRYRLISTCKSDTCELDTLKNKPYTIYVGDISDDKDNWVNKCTGSYFHKIIRLKESPTETNKVRVNN
jgi:hypothetical protein